MTSAAREAILDALETVPDLTVTPSMPNTPTRGCAYPLWAQSQYRDGKLARPLAHTYEVRVILPNGYHPETVDAADGLVERVMAALAKVGQVEAAQPITVVFEANQTTMPGLSVRVTVV